MYRQPRSGFTRIPCVQACQVTSGGRARAGMLCNLSVLGVYLHLEELPEIGDSLAIEFALPDGGGMVAADAVVTWVNDTPPESADALPPGCGLRFTALAPGDVRRIAALVAAFREEPRPLLGRPEPSQEKLRVPFVAPCVVSGAAGPSRGSVCNLSTDGIFVAVDPIPAEGEAVIVAFRFPGQAEAFERTAVVAWRNDDGPQRTFALPLGCGLRFVNLSEGDRTLLAGLVDGYSGTLPAVPRLDGGADRPDAHG